MRLDKRKLYFRIALMILWMLVIFMFSMENADQSSGTSGHLVVWLGQFLGIDLTNMPIVDFLQFIVRKCAHMFAYLILGILAYRVMVLVKPYQPYRYAALITVLYACSDEFHQLFVPGRSGQIKDVFIDITGMLIGFMGIYLVTYFKKKRRLKKRYY